MRTFLYLERVCFVFSMLFCVRPNSRRKRREYREAERGHWLHVLAVRLGITLLDTARLGLWTEGSLFNVTSRNRNDEYMGRLCHHKSHLDCHQNPHRVFWGTLRGFGRGYHG